MLTMMNGLAGEFVGKTQGVSFVTDMKQLYAHWRSARARSVNRLEVRQLCVAAEMGGSSDRRRQQ
jgi:hypothetical protein